MGKLVGGHGTTGLGLGSNHTNTGANGKAKGNGKYRHDKLAEGEYIVPGYDGKGRSDMVQVRILPGYGRMASEVIANSKFPFKTVGDLWRFCIAYGLDHLTSVEPPKFSIMSYIHQESRTIRDQVYMRDHAQTLDALEELVKYHAGQDNHMNKLYAKALVEDAIENAKKIGDATWRRSTLKKLRDRFKTTLEMKVVLPARVTLNPENYDTNTDIDTDTEEDENAGEIW